MQNRGNNLDSNFKPWDPSRAFLLPLLTVDVGVSDETAVLLLGLVLSVTGADPSLVSFNSSAICLYSNLQGICFHSVGSSLNKIDKHGICKIITQIINRIFL